MKVSVITVCFNSSSTIKETIESVLQQDYDNIEYIIIDGKSTDKTIDIINRYKGRIDKFISEKDNGIYDAMNKGIKMATGEIIAILNSDDLFYDLRVISTVVSVFQSRKVHCVYGNLIYFKNNINVPVRIWKTKNISKLYFLLGNMPPHPSLFVLKSVYENIGYYNPSLRISADHEFMIRMLKKHKYASEFLDKYLVKMRLGGVSTSGLKSYLESTKEIKQAWNINGYKYPFWLYFLRPIKKLSEFKITY